MARGWESKDVESQMEQREADKARGPRLSPEEMALAQRRESLLLSIKAVEHDLAQTPHARRREQLQAALQHLQTELKSL